MITKFIEYITEIKNYQLFHGCDDIKKVLRDGYFEGSDKWGGPMRIQLLGGNYKTISATRNFKMAWTYGQVVVEFDLPKLSSRYKIIPFCENVDFYSDKLKKCPTFGKEEKLSKKSNPALFNKKYGGLYWKIKTDQSDYDFGICEELIVADKVPIKYIKRIFTDDKYLAEDLKKKCDIPCYLVDSQNVEWVNAKEVVRKGLSSVPQEQDTSYVLPQR